MRRALMSRAAQIGWWQMQRSISQNEKKYFRQGIRKRIYGDVEAHIWNQNVGSSNIIWTTIFLGISVVISIVHVLFNFYHHIVMVLHIVDLHLYSHCYRVDIDCFSPPSADVDS